MDQAKNVLGGGLGAAFGDGLGGGAAGVEGVHVAAPPADAGSAGDEPAANFYSQAQSNNSPGPAAGIEEEDAAMEEAAPAEEEAAPAAEEAAPAAEEAAAPAAVE